MRCRVCLGPGATKRHTAGGTYYGAACEECHGILWEAHFLEATGAGEYDRALLAWQWRRRRAEAEGRTFLDEPPKSPAELVLEARFGVDLETWVE